MLRALSVILAALCCISCGEDSTKKRVRLDIPHEFVESESPSGINAYLHCEAICALGPRPSNSAGYEAQLKYLEQELGKLEWKTTRRNFKGKNVPMTNLYASFGEGEHVRPLILSCHIDTKIGISEQFIGADDGASAAAALMEIARILKKSPELASQIEIVFFDGEEAFAKSMSHEDGMYGSKWDVARRLKEKAMPRWQINLDMVGGRNMEIAPPAFDTPDEMYDHFNKAVKTLGFSPLRWSFTPTGYLDDHLPFVEEGVSSLNLITRFTQTDWWHTDKDDMSRICPQSLEQICRFTLQLIEQILLTATLTV